MRTDDAEVVVALLVMVWMLPRTWMYIYIWKQAIKLTCSLLLLVLFFPFPFLFLCHSWNLARKNGHAHAPHFDYTIRSFNAPSAGKCYKLHQLRFIKKGKEIFFLALVMKHSRTLRLGETPSTLSTVKHLRRLFNFSGVFIPGRFRDISYICSNYLLPGFSFFISVS